MLGERPRPIAVRGEDVERLQAVAKTRDLRGARSLTFALLDDTRYWRERLVCELALGDSDHVRCRSAYQLRLPLDLVRNVDPSVRPGDLVRLVLPLAMRPKRLLLGVDFEGPDGAPCVLLLREDGSSLETEYLAYLSGVTVATDTHRDPEVRSVIETVWFGLCSYTHDLWRSHEPNWWRRKFTRKSAQRVNALTSYLSAALGWQPTKVQIEAWLSALKPAAALLVKALDEPANDDSPSECVLLAIPHMTLLPGGPEEVDELVREFVASVAAMDQRARRALAEYGRRWVVFLDVVLPVDQVSKVALSEQLPWVGSPSARLDQEIVFGDARTTHLEVRAVDNAVLLRYPVVVDLHGKSVRAINSLRETADAIAIYSSFEERPLFARVRVQAKVRLAHRLLPWVLLGMNVLAGLAVRDLPEATGGSFEDALALLTLPLTFASALVLSRESTPLADRLLQRSRYVLGASVLILWCMTISRLYLFWDVSWPEDWWHAVTNTLGVTLSG